MNGKFFKRFEKSNYSRKEIAREISRPKTYLQTKEEKSRMELENNKQKRIILILGYFFDQNCLFSQLPKELIEIITTTAYLKYSILKKFTTFGCSGSALDRHQKLNVISAVPNTIRSIDGVMVTAICEEYENEEILVWEVLFIYLL